MGSRIMSTYTTHTLVIPAEGDLEYAVSSIVGGMHVGMPVDIIVTEGEAIRILEGLIEVLKVRSG